MYLKIFVWLELLLMTLVVEKGFEEIILKLTMAGLKPQFSLVLIGADFVLIAILFLVFISLVLYILGYLLFTPWPIFHKIFEGVNRLAELGENSLRSRLASINWTDILISGAYFGVEFFISYLMVRSIGKAGLLILMLLLFPLLDMLIPSILGIGFLVFWLLSEILYWSGTTFSVTIEIVLRATRRFGGRFQEYVASVEKSLRTLRDRSWLNSFRRNVRRHRFIEYWLQPFFYRPWLFVRSNLINVLPIGFLFLFLWRNLVNLHKFGNLIALEDLIGVVLKGDCDLYIYLGIIIAGIIAFLTNFFSSRTSYAKAIELLYWASRND